MNDTQNQQAENKPLRIDATKLSKEEAAILASAVFRVRADLEAKGLKLTIRKKTPSERAFM